MRDDPLVIGQTYHIFTRSIAGYVIFNNDEEYSRIVEVMKYYIKRRPRLRFAVFNNLSTEYQKILLEECAAQKSLVDIVAYCVMPTHVHFILRQNEKDGISIYLKNIKDSYTRYFNTKHKRKGPLWEGRFKNVLVSDDEYLLHLSRYVHLNPVTSCLVGKPEDWKYSSLSEYTSPGKGNGGICEFNAMLDVIPADYKSFIDDRIAYQRELHTIKRLILEE